MEPVSILELTITVITLSVKIYDFFKAVHDAPNDILQYLQALEQTRAVLDNTQDYLHRHASSSFHTHDGMELSIVQHTLEDCKLEFALQLSFIESLDSSTSSSFFRSAVRKTKFVLSEEKIEALTQKLQKAQGLLSLAIATTNGKNTVLIRDKLEIVSLEVKEVNERSKAESLARDELLQQLQQYAFVLQDSAKEFLQLAKDTHIRSDTRITDLSQSLGTVDSSCATPMHTKSEASDPVQINHAANDSTHARPNISNAVLERLERSRTDFDRLAKSARTTSPAKENTTTSITNDMIPWEDVLNLTQQSSKTSHSDFSQLAGLAEKFKQVSAAVNGVPSQYEGVISTSIRVIMSTATYWEQDLNFVMQAMEEMSEAIEICSREQNLCQDLKLTRLIEELYLQILEVTNIVLKNCQKSSLSKIIAPLNERDNKLLRDATSKMRRVTGAVLREVDYQHRLEMRMTGNRIVEMQIEQRRMVSLLEDQKRILQGMEEERNVMGVIQGQQAILHIVQQIQRKLQAEADKQ